MSSDEALIERTLRGDLAAFEELVERHRDVVFLGRDRTQRPTPQTLRLREADRRDRTTTVAMTARIRQR
jgi:hypothetical protein